MLYKAVLTFESRDKISSVTTQMKASEKCFPFVLFVIMYCVVLTFESVHEMVKLEMQRRSSQLCSELTAMIFCVFLSLSRSVNM